MKYHDPNLICVLIRKTITSGPQLAGGLSAERPKKHGIPSNSSCRQIWGLLAQLYWFCGWREESVSHTLVNLMPLVIIPERNNKKSVSLRLSFQYQTKYICICQGKGFFTQMLHLTTTIHKYTELHTTLLSPSKWQIPKRPEWKLPMT